jgi:NADH-quinone oxidoreductase subunit G
MNRCIQCYRCMRFYQEYAGGVDFGVTGSAGRVYFGRFESGQLESPFSGNLVDICPTGVFTDKTARFRARYWDYDMAPSVCPGCSLGCATTPVARYRELLKTVGRENPAVNAGFLCDRGRFSNGAVNDPARPRTPLIDGVEAGWNEAFDALVIRAGELADLYGEGSLAVVGSSRLSHEGGVLLAQLARTLGAGFLCYFTAEEEGDRTAAAAALLAGNRTASLEDVRQADCIAILDCDLREEAPMMLLAVRQAWRKGAPVFLVGAHAPLEQAKTVSIEAIQLSILEEAPLAIFERPVVVCGTRNSSPGDIELLAHAEARHACLLPGPNAAGAALLSREHDGTSLAAAIATGRVKGIIAVEAEVPPELLAGVPFVAAVDWQPTAAVRQAQVFLPSTAWVEMDGTFINFEGRGQRFRKVMGPGLPVKGLDPALHPPRQHRRTPPGGEPRPAWQIMADLLARLGDETITDPLAGAWERFRDIDPKGEGVRLHD